MAMDEEERFLAELKKSSTNKMEIVPILGAGVVATASLAGVWLLWPFESIPVYVLFGVPVLCGAGALVGLQKMLGLD